jgi:hypothetical protein
MRRLLITLLCLLPAALYADMDVAVGTFNTADISTTLEINTSPSLQPVALILWWSGRTEGTDSVGASNMMEGVGFAAGTTDRAAECNYAQDGADPTFDRHCLHDAAIVVTHDGTSDFDCEIDLSSFDADGFTVVEDTACTTDLRVHYVAIGGSDVTNAETGIITKGTTGAPFTQEINLTGAFQPSIVIMAPGTRKFQALPDGDDSMTYPSLGAATSTSDEHVVSNCGDSGQSSNTRTKSYGLSGEVAAITNSNCDPEARGEMNSIDSDGFTINWIENSASTHKFPFIAIKGGQWAVGEFLTGTSAGNLSEVSVGFQPKGAIVVSHNVAENSVDVESDHMEFSMGAFQSTTSRVAAAAMLEHGVAGAENAGTAVEYDSICINLTQADPTAVEGLMDVAATSSDGWTPTMDDANPSDAWVFHITFGADAAAVGNSGFDLAGVDVQ